MDWVKLAALLEQLSQKLGVFNASIMTWQTAQSAMDAALADVNAIAVQINTLDPQITIPPFTEPTPIDPAWVTSILDNAAAVKSAGDALKAVVPT
jgi:hypothetical protein